MQPGRISEDRKRAASGGPLLCFGLDQHPHNVALLHDEVLDAIDFDLSARPFAEQNAVSDLDVDRDELAALVAPPGPNGGNLALLRLLLGGIRNDYATSVFASASIRSMTTRS
jgi:hypothetical protein